MTQDISRRWADEPEAKSIENYPAPEDVPQSLKNRLAVELTVRAKCPKCCSMQHYYSSDSMQTVVCADDNCDEEFILP